VLPVFLLKLYKFKPYRDFRENLIILREKVKIILDRQLGELQAQLPNPDRPKSFVEQWLEKGELSKDEIIAQIIDVILAAFDGVSYIFYPIY